MVSGHSVEGFVCAKWHSVLITSKTAPAPRLSRQLAVGLSAEVAGLRTSFRLQAPMHMFDNVTSSSLAHVRVCGEYMDVH
eukprot:719314-Pyramimonas_sp.AAC.1